MAASNQKWKKITINVSAATAAKFEALAASEGRSVSELFDEAFRDYVADVSLRTMEDIRRYAQTRNPKGYTEEDVPRIVKEVRAEMAAEEAALESAKAS